MAEVPSTEEQVRAVFGDAASVTCISCPLQVEGTYRGQWFYFRARSGRWSVAMGSSLDEAVARNMDRIEPRLWGHPEPDEQEAAGTFGVWLRDRLEDLADVEALIRKYGGPAYE